MKTRNTAPALAGVLAAGAATLTPVAAIDIGDPAYPAEPGTRGQLEVIYERFDRDTVLQPSAMTLTGPGGTADAVTEGFTTGMDEDLYILRGTLYPSPTVAVYGDVGIRDDDDESSLFLGGGVRVQAYRRDPFRLTLFGAGHYAPPWESTLYDTDPEWGRAEWDGETDYYEVGGGALVSADLRLNARSVLVPYAGAAYSVLRGSVEVDANYPEVGVKGEMDIDIEEDEAVQVIIGAALRVDERWSLRVEGRVLGDSSVSAGLGMAF